MGSLLVVLIVLGCVAYQYLKGTFVKSFVMVVISICASVVAFGYFEFLANILISREILMSWAQPLFFVLLFILAFAVLQTIAVQIARRPVDLGLLPERIGRVICGIFLGLIVSGLLLTVIAMTPISAKYPYQRFDEINPDLENPGKALLNTDGFVAGWFSIISSGSFSGKRSFATLHPAFLDQLFLNRLEIADGISSVTSPEAVEIRKQAVWPAPKNLKDSDGNTDLSKNGYKLTIVRVGITYQPTRNGETFTPAQLRLVCKPENDDRDRLTGKGKNIYTVGYLKAADELQVRKLADRIEIKKPDFEDRVKEIDFVFYVPEKFEPVLVEYKQNSVDRLPPPTAADQAPPAVPFVSQSERAESAVESPAPAKDAVTEDTTKDEAGDTTKDTAEPNSSE